MSQAHFVRDDRMIDEIAAIVGEDKKLLQFVKRLHHWFPRVEDVLLILREAIDAKVIQKAKSAAAIRQEPQ